MPPPAAPSPEVDAYIEAADSAAQPILQKIRQLVRQAVPGAQETIAYKMPAFRQGRVFLYVAAFKHHIGVYPPLTTYDALRHELQPYANAKGSLRFALNQPMPYALIARVAHALAAQYARKP